MSAQSYRHCQIASDEEHLATANGLVIINGPNCSVYVYDNGPRNKPRQVDRLVRVKQVVDDGTLVVSGRSEYHERPVSMAVTPKKGCATCG